MNVKLKQAGFLWEKKVCVPAEIADVLVKQDPASPARSVVSVFYKGVNGKGILEFSLAEFAHLERSIAPAVQLLRDATSSHRMKG